MHCTQCNTPFNIYNAEQDFFQKLDLPLPTVCPNCRQQRRLAFRNTRNLYKRDCDKCSQSMLSIYSADKRMTVFCQMCYWDESWSPLEYGVDYNFSKPFFEQFDAFLRTVPVPNQIFFYLSTLENCQYNNEITRSKNCYMIFDGEEAEYSLYGETFYKINNCMDFYRLMNCELCYECMGCERCYNLKYSAWCSSCSDSWFLMDCHGSRNCFGSINLVNQEYYIYNKFVGEKKYKDFIQHLDLTLPAVWQEVQETIHQVYSQQPRRAVRGHHNENVTGDNLYHSSDAFDSYDCTELKNCRYCTELPLGAKDSQDLDIWGGQTELCYNGSIGHDVRNIVAGFYVFNKCHDIQYALFCRKGSHDLFGCVSLEKQSYCIFNKQYSKEAYNTLRGKIIEQMKQTGEYGAYWPVEYSPFAYNESKAMDYFPLTREKIIQRGWQWHETQLPKASNDSVMCQQCKRPFKLVKLELDFYHKNNLPIPNNCFACRHQVRLQNRNPRRLFLRNCDKCAKEIQSTHDPEKPELVYCEECYRETVY